MHKAISILSVAAAAAVALTGAPAMADDVEVHKVKTLNTTETRSAGHVEFLQDKLLVWTDDNSSQAKAAGYFPMNGYTFPTSGSLDWNGSSPQPGQQLVFDFDNIAGNGNDYNVLVGEPVYGGNWWLTNGSSADAKAADPSGANDGGNGSAYFGTLAEWKAAMPDATTIAGGFSLGSGIKGFGVIHSITYGDHVFEFEGPQGPKGDPGTDGQDGDDGTDGQDGAKGDKGDTGAKGSTGATGAQGPAGKDGTATPLTDATPLGSLTWVKPASNRVKLVLTTSEQPANTRLSKTVHWVIKSDGRRFASIRQGFDARDTATLRFPKGTGKHVVTVTRDGVIVKTTTVRTGR